MGYSSQAFPDIQGEARATHNFCMVKVKSFFFLSIGSDSQEVIMALVKRQSPRKGSCTLSGNNLRNFDGTLLSLDCISSDPIVLVQDKADGTFEITVEKSCSYGSCFMSIVFTIEDNIYKLTNGKKHMFESAPYTH